VNAPYVRYGHERRGPHRPTMRVRHRQVVAGGAVGVGAQLQAHVNAYEALGGLQPLPFGHAAKT
jgi:hypothetical protein